jgi:hypothetical protein
MHTFTAVLAVDPWLPPDLAILIAPVRAAEPSDPDEHVGNAEGVLLDQDGRVAAFILRLAGRVDLRHGRVLVPATALRLTEGPYLRLAWTEDQLRAQPRLDQDLQPHNRVDGGPPVESHWMMPARPSVIPPGPFLNKSAAAWEGLQGGIVGAIVGVVAGLAVGGPAAVVPAMIFFAAGAGLAGLLSGASQESAAEASEMSLPHLDPNDHRPLAEALQRLEDRLLGPHLVAAVANGFVTARKVRPLTTSSPPAPSWRAALGWR